MGDVPSRESGSLARGLELVLSASTCGHEGQAVNEDALSFRWYEGVLCAAVADGMGGMAAGHLASQTAVQVFTENVEWLDATAADLAERCLAAARQASRAVRQALGSREGGCAFTGIAITEGAFALAHAGDTRAYLVTEDGWPHQLTVDHSVAALELRRGTWQGDEQALLEAQRQLYRFVGSHSSERARYVTDLTSTGHPPILPLPRRATLLILTDGIWGVISPQDFGRLLAALTPQRAAEALVLAAQQAGLRDDAAALTIFRP